LWRGPAVTAIDAGADDPGHQPRPDGRGLRRAGGVFAVYLQVVLSRALLNRGVLAAGNGLMALSTPMTDADIDAIIDAASGALSEVSASL
jgi:hypothetical protein